MNEMPQATLNVLKTNLLIVGASASTHRLDNTILKVTRIDEDVEITQSNAHAMRTEANVYRILGASELIANCLYISPLSDILLLEFYPNGNLRDHVAEHSAAELRKWARQMIEAVAFLHGKGVRYADLRLDQWLLDAEFNARLSLTLL